MHSLGCLCFPSLESAPRFCDAFPISGAALGQRQTNIKGVQRKSLKPLELLGI